MRTDRYALVAVALVAATTTGQTVDRERGVRGVVVPEKQVALHAPIDGELAKMNVVEGLLVKRGEPLAEMESSVQRAELATARVRANSDVAIVQAKLELDEAQVKLEQMEAAFRAEAAQGWEVRRARLQRDIAQVRLRAANDQHAVAQAELAMQEAVLKRYTLHAPWDARVINVAAKQGATLTRSDVVVQLASMRVLEAEVFVPVEWRDRLTEGDRYTFDAGSPVNQPITGRLRFASPVIDPASDTFRCVFVVDNADEKLPAGFSVTMRQPASE